MSRTIRLLGKGYDVVGVTPRDELHIVTRLQALMRVLANRLEHRETLARKPQEALVDQGRERVDFASHTTSAASTVQLAKIDELREERALALVKKVVAPFHHRAQARLAWNARRARR